MNSSQSGQIITFYSYKGGTGRTMALANVACLLAKDHPTDVGTPPRVLAIDWDLEAPGLHRYFRPYLTSSSGEVKMTSGCLELFQVLNQSLKDFSTSDFEMNRKSSQSLLAETDFSQYILPTQITNLHIMKAGCFDEGYSRRVGEFQWDRLFMAAPGLFLGFADFLRSRYDYILVDSRTGISDTSGICTMVLPEKLVVVFTPNQQSLTGIGELTKKAVNYRKSSPDGRPLLVFPLPSRIEMARPALFESWRMGRAPNERQNNLPVEINGYQPLFEKLFTEIYSPESVDLTEYLDEVMLQHIPDYAYGEPIAVMLEETESRLFLRSSYAAFTERLVELQVPWESILIVRQEKAIDQKVRDAVASIQGGDIQNSLRMAWELMEKKPSPGLFDQVANAILDVIQAAYPQARSAVSSLLAEAMRRMMDAKTFEPETVAGILVRTGDICLKEEDFKLAAMALEKAVQIMAENFSDDNPELLHVENKLARALLGAENFAKVQKISEKLLAKYSEQLGNEHPAILFCKEHLAAAYFGLGDYSRAQELQEEVLDVRRRTLGEDHPDTLNSMNNLGETLKAPGDFSKAASLLEKVLDARRRLQGEEHPDTLTSMKKLAAILREKGDIGGARNIQEKVLETTRRILGQEHPDTLNALNQLMLTAKEAGDIDTVLKLSQELSDSYKKQSR